LQSSPDLLDVFGVRQLLRHHPANIDNRLSHFPPNFNVSAVCGVLAAYAVALKLVRRLRSAEKVGGKFGAAHVVKDGLPIRGALPAANARDIQAAIQSLASLGLNDGKLNPSRTPTFLAALARWRLCVLISSRRSTRRSSSDTRGDLDEDDAAIRTGNRPFREAQPVCNHRPIGHAILGELPLRLSWPDDNATVRRARITTLDDELCHFCNYPTAFVDCACN
jgi:hypothetical protein